MPSDFRELDRWKPTRSTSLADLVWYACRLEATAPKVGNVHPSAPFPDMSYEDFVASADAIRPIFHRSPLPPCGQLIRLSVQATRSAVDLNTNLGILLLFGPLVHALSHLRQQHQSSQDLASYHQAVTQVLENLDATDAADIYAAIRLAKPSGLGEAEAMDVHSPHAPLSIREAMKLAASRDLIAAEYTQAFPRSHRIAKELITFRQNGCDWLVAITLVHLHQLSLEADSHIGRKFGSETAEGVRSLAETVYADAREQNFRIPASLARLDDQLRSPKTFPNCHWNPGTTADLVAAGILLAAAWESEQPL